jgi:enoyl-CoA hydratase/carnithine racemase
MESTSNTILTDTRERILTVQLNRPEHRNAMTREMVPLFIDILDKADRDDDVRVILLTGTGKYFCVGADLEAAGGAFKGMKVADDETARDAGGVLTLRMFASKKPIIAAINGTAVGIGLTMTLPADIRLMVNSGKYGFPFSSRGIVPESASSWFLPRIVGIEQALDWMLTARIFSAEDALRAGLVSAIVEPEELIPCARRLAARMVANTSAVSTGLTRQLLWRMCAAAHPKEAHEMESRLIHYLVSHGEAREGVASFLEKRPANFPLRVSSDFPISILDQ